MKLFLAIGAVCATTTIAFASNENSATSNVITTQYAPLGTTVQHQGQLVAVAGFFTYEKQQSPDLQAVAIIRHQAQLVERAARTTWGAPRYVITEVNMPSVDHQPELVNAATVFTWKEVASK